MGRKEPDHKGPVGQGEDSGLCSKDKSQPLLGFKQGTNTLICMYNTQCSCGVE